MTIDARQSAAERYCAAEAELDELRHEETRLQNKKHEALTRQAEARTELEKTVGHNVTERVFLVEGKAVIVSHRSEGAARVLVVKPEPTR